MTVVDFFAFEADFVDSLRCIPMRVRFNLDTCGVKLKLHHWHGFSAAERQQLVALACDTTEAIAVYREHLQNLVTDQTGEPAKTLPIDPHPPWLNSTAIPEQVIQKAQSLDLALSPEQWQHLTPLQRFALLKLSRPSHENRNFLPAFQEFGLAIAENQPSA